MSFLVLFSTNTSVFLTKYLLSLNLAIIIFVNFAVFVLVYLDFKIASTIATSIVHSKLDYCNSLYYNLPQSQIKNSRRSRTLLLVLSPERQNSSRITPVLKSLLHWLKINERIKYKLDPFSDL